MIKTYFSAQKGVKCGCVLINEKYCHFEAGTLIKPILVVEPIPAVKPIPALEPNPVVNITPSIPIPIPTNFLEVNVIPIPTPKKIGIITPLLNMLWNENANLEWF